MICLSTILGLTVGMSSLTADEFTKTKPVTAYKKGRYQKVYNKAKTKTVVDEKKGKMEFANTAKNYSSPMKLKKYNDYYMETVHAQKGRVYMLRNHKPINQDTNVKPIYAKNFRPSNMDMNFGSVYTRQQRLKAKLAAKK